MAKIERIEPTDLPSGLWLNGNEYASDNVEEAAGVLSLETGETEGYRVGPELDVGAITDVDSSKLEWTSTGDVEVLAAVSETSAKGSMSFDGVDDYVGSVGSLSTFSFVQNTSIFSIFCWVYARSASTVRPIIGNATDGTARGFMVRIETSGVFSVYIRNGTSVGESSVFQVASFPTDEWVFLSIRADGTNLFVQYNNVNQVFSALQNNLGTTATGNSSNVLTIGRNPDSISQLFFGNLYAPIIYNAFLTEQQSTNLYNGDLVADGLVGHWPLDDPPGSTTARDISGNNNDGTIIGASYSPDNPLLQAAINGQAIPGVSSGDDLTGKKLYMQQRLSRAVGTDPSPTLTSLYTEITTMDGDLRSLINGGLIRSAHTQNNTIIT